MVTDVVMHFDELKELEGYYQQAGQERGLRWNEKVKLKIY